MPGVRPQQDPSVCRKNLTDPEGNAQKSSDRDDRGRTPAGAVPRLARRRLSDQRDAPGPADDSHHVAVACDPGRSLACCRSPVKPFASGDGEDDVPLRRVVVTAVLTPDAERGAPPLLDANGQEHPFAWPADDARAARAYLRAVRQQFGRGIKCAGGNRTCEKAKNARPRVNRKNGVGTGSP